MFEQRTILVDRWNDLARSDASAYASDPPGISRIVGIDPVTACSSPGKRLLAAAELEQALADVQRLFRG